MWLFTKYGFFSVVCARQGEGGHDQAVDLNRFMVRARLREHLTALQQRFPELLADSEIREFAGSDYAYRIFVPKAVWSQVLVGLNDELDYDNFKSKAAEFLGAAGDDYLRKLHEVWSVMSRLQK